MWGWLPSQDNATRNERDMGNIDLIEDYYADREARDYMRRVAGREARKHARKGE